MWIIVQEMTIRVWPTFWINEWLWQIKARKNTGKVKMICDGEYGDRHDKSLIWILSSREQKWGFSFSKGMQNHVFWIIFLVTIICILSHWMILKDFSLARRDIDYKPLNVCYSTLYSAISSWNPKSPHHRFCPCGTEKVVNSVGLKNRIFTNGA